MIIYPTEKDAFTLNLNKSHFGSILADLVLWANYTSSNLNNQF